MKNKLLKQRQEINNDRKDLEISRAEGYQYSAYAGRLKEQRKKWNEEEA